MVGMRELWLGQSSCDWDEGVFVVGTRELWLGQGSCCDWDEGVVVEMREQTFVMFLTGGPEMHGQQFSSITFIYILKEGIAI